MQYIYIESARQNIFPEIEIELNCFCQPYSNIKTASGTVKKRKQKFGPEMQFLQDQNALLRPLMNISTAIAVKIMPINLSKAPIILLPRSFIQISAETSIRPLKNHASTRDTSHKNHFWGLLAISSIRIVIVEGPAKNGIARGTMNGSVSGWLAKIFSEDEKIIRIAIRNNMIPPAMPIDEREICRNSRM